MSHSVSVLVFAYFMITYPLAISYFYSQIISPALNPSVLLKLTLQSMRTGTSLRIPPPFTWWVLSLWEAHRRESLEPQVLASPWRVTLLESLEHLKVM